MARIELKDLLKVIDMDERTLRLIQRLVGYKEELQCGTINTHGALVLVVCDFLRATGMPLEHYTACIEPFVAAIRAYAQELESALIAHVDGLAAKIPWLFMSIVDNRYVGVQKPDLAPVDTVPSANVPELWDISSEGYVPLPEAPPVFTISLSIGALYFRTLARLSGFEKAADDFQNGRLISRPRKEGKHVGDKGSDG